ncbi:MAG: hypothetical protein R2797_11830 [Gelidibacter sp.]
MIKEKLKPIVKGIIKHILLKKVWPKQPTGGGGGGSTTNSRYCYSVWMRHLQNLNEFQHGVPKIVAEFGPGNSLGCSLAALLSGAEKIYGFDVVKYWDNDRNVRMFDDLIQLFKDRTAIPDQTEFVKVRPVLNDYKFPSHILTDDLLMKSLAIERLEAIRKELMDIDNPNNRYIKFQIPWNDTTLVEKNSVDFIFSQAVLMHIYDLDDTYKVMRDWLKLNGYMSHTIDFKSLGSISIWNGHYTYKDWEWEVVTGGKNELISRLPCSAHVALHHKYNFKILKQVFDKKGNKLSKKDLATRFKELSNEDLTTSGMYILSQKV